jgi:hypothetical protein
MPFVKDFSTLRGRGTIELEVPKWSSPLYIEYGYDYISAQLYFFWRVQGTSHTFRIGYLELMELSNGDYEKHIFGFLKSFRIEYLSWINSGLKEQWMQEYYQEYKNFIEF